MSKFYKAIVLFLVLTTIFATVPALAAETKNVSVSVKEGLSSKKTSKPKARQWHTKNPKKTDNKMTKGKIQDSKAVHGDKKTVHGVCPEEVNKIVSTKAEVKQSQAYTPTKHETRKAKKNRASKNYTLRDLVLEQMSAYSQYDIKATKVEPSKKAESEQVEAEIPLKCEENQTKEPQKAEKEPQKVECEEEAKKDLASVAATPQDQMQEQTAVLELTDAEKAEIEKTKEAESERVEAEIPLVCEENRAAEPQKTEKEPQKVECVIEAEKDFASAAATSQDQMQEQRAALAPNDAEKIEVEKPKEAESEQVEAEIPLVCEENRAAEPQKTEKEPQKVECVEEAKKDFASTNATSQGQMEEQTTALEPSNAKEMEIRQSKSAVIEQADAKTSLKHETKKVKVTKHTKPKAKQTNAKASSKQESKRVEQTLEPKKAKQMSVEASSEVNDTRAKKPIKPKYVRAKTPAAVERGSKSVEKARDLKVEKKLSNAKNAEQKPVLTTVARGKSSSPSQNNTKQKLKVKRIEGVKNSKSAKTEKGTSQTQAPKESKKSRKVEQKIVFSAKRIPVFELVRKALEDRINAVTARRASSREHRKADKTFELGEKHLHAKALIKLGGKKADRK